MPHTPHNIEGVTGHTISMAICANAAHCPVIKIKSNSVQLTAEELCVKLRHRGARTHSRGKTSWVDRRALVGSLPKGEAIELSYVT